MFQPCDIFKVDDTGTTVWIDAVWSLEDARVSVEEMMLESPGEYVIVNLATHDRMLVKPGDLAH